MNLTVTQTYDNWLTLLRDLSSGKLKLTAGEQEVLACQAWEWPTCACGQLCSVLPRDGNGAPKDSRLATLGLDFARYVEDKEYDSALSTFLSIEHRTYNLLQLQ